jgi:hypothetical protein
VKFGLEPNGERIATRGVVGPRQWRVERSGMGLATGMPSDPRRAFRLEASAPRTISSRAMARSYARACLLLGLGVLATTGGCGKTPGEGIRPNDPAFGGARGEKAPAVCHEVPEEGTPLVVGWSPEERGDLEAAMQQGVAVVNYDCKSVMLLPDCHLDGKYGFIGITKKEQVISIENADRAQANLPLHGASIGASMERGSGIDIGVVMVGKKTRARS